MTRATRVLLVSTSYPADHSDWRGVFIRHQIESLCRRDDIALRVWCPPGQLPGNAEYVATAAEQAWLAQLMQAGGIAQRLRSRSLTSLLAPIQLMAHQRRTYRRESNLDVYHINWLQNALMLPQDGVPLLVTVLGTDMQLLGLPLMRRWLQRVFRGRRVAICPNAAWMVPALERAFGNVAQVECLPFGIDPSWFGIERRIAPDPPARWLCVSRLTRDKIGPLFDWCEPHFRDGRRTLHLFGPMQQSLPVPAWVHYHGPATPRQLCEEWFPRATGLITLSQHAEGRPQVMLEAMASALPIVASRLPAHDDMLDHARTGWLCGAAEELGGLLSDAEQSETNRRVGEDARAWVGRTVGTWDDCAERYAAVYRRLIGAKPP